MKDSNLQVVSDRTLSKRLQFHYGNTAYLAVCQTATKYKIKKDVNPDIPGIGGVRFGLTNPKELIYSQLALTTCISAIDRCAFLLNCHIS